MTAIAIVPKEWAHLAGLTVTVKVDERRGDRRQRKGSRPVAREHGERARQRRQAHLTLYPKLVIVED